VTKRDIDSDKSVTFCDMRDKRGVTNVTYSYGMSRCHSCPVTFVTFHQVDEKQGQYREQ